MQVLDDINEAMILLENNIPLVSYNNKNKTLYVFKNDKICVYTDNVKYFVNKIDFFELFCLEEFFIYDPSDKNDIDILKDEEYYSWRK